MNVKLLAHTNNPDKIISCAAKLCYSPTTIDNVMDDLTDEKVESFLDMLSTIGHESPIEHASFTFGIEGVSRAFLAQVTRHRIASFSVQSQRYVKEGNFTYVVPPEIEKNKSAKEEFIKAMENCQNSYNKLADILEKEHYNKLISKGKDEKTAKRTAEKMAIEDARFVLPNACDTKMIATFNTRSLYNFFSLRCCSRAQWEIREVATQMLKLCREVSPILFKNAGPKCTKGSCPEGKMTCGKMAEVKEKFKNL